MPRSRRAKFGLSWTVYGNFRWGQELSNRYHILTQASNTKGSILMDIVLDGKTLYLSDKYITVTSIEHEGMVSDWGSSDFSIGGNSISSLADITITLFNKRLSYMTTAVRFSDIITTYTLEGRIIHLRQYFEGIAYDECAIFHTGKINSVKYDDLNVTLDIVSDEDVFKEIPINRISKVEFPNAPDESIGIGKPIIFGRSTYRESKHFKNMTLFPTFNIDKITNKYLLADHDLKQATFYNFGELSYANLYMYIEDINKYLMMGTSINSTYTHAESGSYCTLNEATSWTYIARPTEKGTQYDLAATDYRNAIDENDSTTFVLEDNKKFYLRHGKFHDYGSFPKSEGFNIVIVTAVAGSSPYGTIKYYNPDYNEGAGGFSDGLNITGTGTKIYNFNSDHSAHGKYYDQRDEDDSWYWTELDNHEFGITVNAGCTITISDFYLLISGISFDITGVITRKSGNRRGAGAQGSHRLMSRVMAIPKTETTIVSPIYSHMQGGTAMFGSWVTEGSRSNGHASGEAIECPVYVMEYVLRKGLNRTTNDIDWQTFDTAGNTTNGIIKSWKFMGSISAIESSEDVLQRMCMQSKSRLARDSDDSWTLFTYNSSSSLTYTNYKFDKTNYIKNLKVSRSPRNDICNTIRINYCLDAGSGKYTKQTFIECVKKFSGTYLNEPVDSLEWEIDVDDGSTFISGDYILIDHEVNRVSFITGNTLSLEVLASVRATFANSVNDIHADNTPIYILQTKSDDGLGVRDQNTTDPDDREFEAMESVWRYDITNEFSIDCDYIVDDATAQALREHYFDYLKSPKYIVDFDTFLNASALIVNDIFSFDEAIMDDYMKLGGDTWASQKFVCLSVERTGNLDFHIVAEHLTYDFI